MQPGRPSNMSNRSAGAAHDATRRKPSGEMTKHVKKDPRSPSPLAAILRQPAFFPELVYQCGFKTEAASPLADIRRSTICSYLPGERP